MILKDQIRLDSDLVGAVRQDAGDTFDLDAPILTPEGYHRFDGRITRSGILKYRDGDKVRVEYRPPEEVEKALESMNGLPITLTHKAGLLTSANAKENTVGATLSPRFDGKWVRAQHIVYNASDVDTMRKQALRQTSQGYRVDYDPTPGVTPDGVRYDGVQRNIRPNHQAMVKKARAGHECQVRLDGALATDTTEQTEQRPMFKHADGTEFATQAALDAYTKAVDARDELKGRLDHAEKLGTDEVINARIKERRALERAAESLQSDDKRLDGIEDMSDKDLMVAAIKLHDAEFDGANMPAGEIRGWFKAMVASHAAKPASTDATQAQRQDAADKSAEPTAPTSKDPRKGKGDKRPNGMFMSNEERKRLLAQR